ncbi:MAG TPA: hypothetical protein VN668_01495 [Stellaceae bacterium]|nr:hypothetical protein [Stellaceae bacterium]
MAGDKELTNLTVAVEIERLLSGASDGAPLFQALYGAVADEPVPERLLQVVRECCEPAVEPETVPAVTAQRRLAAS